MATLCLLNYGDHKACILAQFEINRVPATLYLCRPRFLTPSLTVCDNSEVSVKRAK